jgi:hypothetical protein
VQEAINLCLSDDISERPNFVQLQGEIEYAIILEYCNQKTEEDDNKAITFINQTDDFLLNYEVIVDSDSVLRHANFCKRFAIVKALEAKKSELKTTKASKRI